MKKQLIVSIAAAAIAGAPAALAQAAAAPPAAADAVAALQKVCLPVLRGGPLKPAAQSAGFKLADGGWVLPLAGKGEIDLGPPDASNPHVCTLIITAPDASAAMRDALGAWASAQNPPLKAIGVDQTVPGAQQDWVTSTWSAQTAAGAESVVLTEPRPAAAPATGAAPAGAAASTPSTLLVSLSPA